MEDLLSSEQELLELHREGKIREEEYKQLLEALRKPQQSYSQRPVNIIRKIVPWMTFAIIAAAVASIILQMTMSAKVKEHKNLTISKAYWFHSDDRPRSIPADAVPEDEDGHMLFHVDEWFEDIESKCWFCINFHNKEGCICSQECNNYDMFCEDDEQLFTKNDMLDFSFYSCKNYWVYVNHEKSLNDVFNEWLKERNK